MDGFAQIVTWILVTLLVILTYKYLTRTYKYWESQGLAAVKPYLIFGSISVWTKPLHVLELHLYKKLGRIYGRYDGQQPVLTVGDPEVVRSVLVRDFHVFPNHRDLKFRDPVVDNMLFILENEDWKRVRNTVSPAFTTTKLRRMASSMKDATNQLVHHLQKLCKENKPLDCQRMFGAFTMDVIASCAFGIKIDSLQNPDNLFIKNAKGLLEGSFSWRTLFTVLFPAVMKLFRLSLFNPDPIQFFQNTILNVIQKRKGTNNTYNDFLQMVLDSESRDDSCELREQQLHETGSDGTHPLKSSSKGLSHDELVAQCVTFFTAGYDSTTSLLSYVMYNLAIHPQCQDRVLKEIKNVLQGKDEITYEDVNKMKYLDAVISECLRLCPPVVRLERRAAEQYTLGDTGITVEKGMLVSIPVFAMHYDPEWYPNPNCFDPERFTEQGLTRHPYTHLPFGSGPRMCIGKRFVMMEVKICLAKVLRQFRVKQGPESQVPLGFQVNRGVMSPNRVVVRLEERGQ